MSYHDVRINDGWIIFDTEGGPRFQTDIAPTDNGAEARNIDWDESLGEYNVGDFTVTKAELDACLRFFRARKGRAYSFRFKDWGDFEVALTDGLLTALDTAPPTGLGAGVPTYELWKGYSDGAGSDYERVYRPTIVTEVRRAGSPVTVGAGAGQISIDMQTGRVTFVADAVANATSITVGATTQVVLSSNPGGLVTAGKLYLTGFAGAHASLVNDQAHTINNITGSGPFTFTLNVNTAGKTITLGSGQGRKYPQPSEALAWSGEFDKIVRFGVDKLTYSFRAMDKDGGERLFYLARVPIVMDRMPLDP